MNDLRPPAIVIGLCAHGLAIARALERAGVYVFALEARPGVPGVRTRCAEVLRISDMNGPGLVDEILNLRARRFPSGLRPVLMPTNDRMVEQLSVRTHALESGFRLSWHRSASTIRSLLAKDNIEARCQAVGLNYPKSLVWDKGSGTHPDVSDLRFPLILKPVRPLGRFKTAVVETRRHLDRLWPKVAGESPLLLQEFIPGDDTVIRFGALVLDDGKVRARFEGRKLRSRPMGHTTLAVSEADDRVHELALRFFDSLALSGPVSLEVKQDPAGEYWVIEPTVGRTDFWVGLCIANGVNLPLVEYQVALGFSEPMPVQSSSVGWINGERDPWALLSLLVQRPGEAIRRRWKGVYADVGDPVPLCASWASDAAALPVRLGRWTIRRLGIYP